MSDFDEAVIQRIKQLEREVERLQRWEQPVGKWQSYTVSWSAEYTNPAIGNGTLIGRYTQIGKTVMGSIYLKCGSTTTFGSGTWRFSLPKISASSNMPFMGHFAILDNGTCFYVGAILIDNGFAYFEKVRRDGDGNGAFSSTLPHVWAVNDELQIAFTYETA